MQPPQRPFPALAHVGAEVSRGTGRGEACETLKMTKSGEFRGRQRGLWDKGHSEAHPSSGAVSTGQNFPD